MPRTSVLDPDKVAKAASLLKQAPILTVRQAMLASEFTIEEARTKWTQRKVTRSLLGKTKRNSTDNSSDPRPVSSISNLNSKISTTMLPLSDPSGVVNDENKSPSPQRKLKKHRLTSKQAQDERENNLWEHDIVRQRETH